MTTGRPSSIVSTNINADRVWTAPYYPNNAQERHYRRTTPAAKQPRTYVGDLERAQNMLDYRSGRGNPIPDYSTKGLHNEAYTVNQWRERQDSDLIPPPKSAKRGERASGPSVLTSQQARHLQDLQLDEVCRTEARERKRSLENRRQVEKGKAVDNAGDIEKQDGEATDIPDLDPNRYRPFTCSKTFNRFFDWIAMSPSFYVGVIMLVVFLATTLFLVLRPPRSLEIMRLDTKHLFNGVNYNSNSFIARDCGYELLPPNSRLALGNTSNVGRHRPLRLDRDDANITIPDHIELYMFSTCYDGVFGRQCHFGNPLLPLNWNITSVVERAIKPTFKGLDDIVQSGLVNAALKEEFVKIINQKVAEANPDPARIDMLGWGWPMAVWPKPSSFFAEKEQGLNRTVLLLNQYIFDGEVQTGNATSTPYSVILLIFGIGICFLGIATPCLFVMSGGQVNNVPCRLGYFGVGVPIATLAIVGASLENGASGWNPTRCALVQYAGLALRPFWVRDYLQWYFWTGAILFGAFAFAYLIRRILSRQSIADTQDLGSWGCSVFWILSFMTLIAATVTGHRSMKSKAQAINSISEYLGMSAVPGKGYWIAVCVAEFLTLWIGLAFLSHALNFRFREHEESFKTSENRYLGIGVRTRSGARISAPIMAPSMTRSRERTKTPEAIPEEVEADGSSTGRRPSTTKQDAEHPHNDEVDVMVKEIEALVGENKGTEAENLRGSKDKARAISEALVDKDQSEHESGVAMSSIRRSPVNCTVPSMDLFKDKREEGEQVDDQQEADRQHHERSDSEHGDSEHQVSEHGGSNHQDSHHRNSQHGNNEHPDADDNTVDNVSPPNVEGNEEPRDEAGRIDGRPRANTSFRWSAPASASDPGRTTRGSWNQPRTPSVSTMDYQQSERYDAADESSRSGTPMSRLRLQRDGTSGRTRHLTEGGHVFDMVQRLSRHEE